MSARNGPNFDFASSGLKTLSTLAQARSLPATCCFHSALLWKRCWRYLPSTFAAPSMRIQDPVGVLPARMCLAWHWHNASVAMLRALAVPPLC